MVCLEYETVSIGDGTGSIGEEIGEEAAIVVEIRLGIAAAIVVVVEAPLVVLRPHLGWRPQDRPPSMPVMRFLQPWRSGERSYSLTNWLIRAGSVSGLVARSKSGSRFWSESVVSGLLSWESTSISGEGPKIDPLRCL